jgi:hypothetical protein
MTGVDTREERWHNATHRGKSGRQFHGAKQVQAAPPRRANEVAAPGNRVADRWALFNSKVLIYNNPRNRVKARQKWVGREGKMWR